MARTIDWQSLVEEDRMAQGDETPSPAYEFTKRTFYHEDIEVDDND